MIKLKNINKFYYKGEQRELHVLNNISIDLPDHGFISILGESGSGKTTLLNIIGGLDKFNAGEIIFNEKSFKNVKNNKEYDEYRKNHIGYIFQNYLLFNNKTVYNNLKIALELIGIKDKRIQNERIESALKAVGMFNYKKKLVKNLSGGQMQRVSIARALIKDSSVILADEPTGNIDSDNTKIVADLLKELSLTRLVIMVTHEKYLAESYSDYIIHIKDGKIESFEENNLQGSYDTNSTRVINISELEKDKAVLESNSNIELYYDDKSSLKNVKLILKNNTLYIETENNLVDIKNSSVKIVDGTKKQEERRKYNFDFKYEESNYKETFKEKCLNALINVRNLLTGGKKSIIIFRVIFFIIGIILASTVISLSEITYVDTSNLFHDDNAYVIKNDKSIEISDFVVNKTSVYMDLVNDGIKINPTLIKSEYINLNYPINFIENKAYQKYIHSAIYHDGLNIVAGRALKNNEIMITTKVCDEMIEKLDINSNDYEYILGQINLINERIVGIVKSNDMIVYESPLTHNSNYFEYYNVNHIYVKNSTTPTYTIKNGRDLVDTTDLIVSTDYDFYNIGETITIYFDNQTNNTYKVVGYFESQDKKMNFISMDSALSNYVYLYNLFEPLTINTFNYIDETYYTLVDGNIPTKIGDILVSDKANYSIGDTIDNYGTIYTVTGIYNLNDNACVGDYDLEYLGIISKQEFINDNTNIALILSNNDVEKIKNKGFTVQKIYDYQYKQALEYNKIEKLEKMVTVIVMLAIVMVYTYFTAKSKMISDIKDIGLYRALGRSKKDIKNHYALYSLLETTVSSAIGYIITIIIGGYLNQKLKSFYLIDYDINYLYVILGLGLLYVLNLLIGLLPINTLLGKTPSEILSKYDI